MNRTGDASLAIGDSSRVGTRLLGLAAGAAAFAFVLVTAITLLGGASLGSGDVQSTEAEGGAASALAVAEIPPAVSAPVSAGRAALRLDWAILAGIGKVECDHGRDPDPSCTQEGAVNAAGAGGPMQFIASTWARYGVDAEGDGPPDRWDPADAIFAAANYLRASGAPGDYARAIFAYNHASWYVAEVESWAARYSAAAAAQSAAGEGARRRRRGHGARR